MTKPSPIMIMKAHPLDGFSEFERSVVRRFLFECFQGLNEQHHTRWLRLWSRLWKSEVGQVAQLDNVVERDGRYHRMHMAMETELFSSQECWGQIGPMRDWLKVGAAWGEWQPNPRGGLRFVPNSTSFENCSDDEMREVHTAMVAFLHTPHAQRRLWPHINAARRAEMLETILNKPEAQS